MKRVFRERTLRKISAANDMTAFASSPGLSVIAIEPLTTGAV